MTEYKAIIEKVRTRELAFLRGRGLTMEDAEDVFQDAALAFYEQLREQRLQIKSNPEGYLHGICHNLATKRIEALGRQKDCIDDEKLDRLLQLTEDAQDDDIIDETESGFSYEMILGRILSELTQRDLALINGFYIEGKSMQQLAEELQMATAEVVKTTKCRLLNRMRERATTLINECF